MARAAYTGVFNISWNSAIFTAFQATQEYSQRKTIMKNNSPSDTERLLNASEVAETLNISKTFVYKLVGTGELRSVKIGTAIRVRQVHLDNYINNCLSPASSEESLN